MIIGGQALFLGRVALGALLQKSVELDRTDVA